MKTLIIFTTLSFVMTSLHAQSMDEFKQWKQSVLGDYSDYKDDIDREFARFLEFKWDSFETKEGAKRDTNPKPVIIPKISIKKTTPKSITPVKSVPVTLKPIKKKPFPKVIKAVIGEKTSLNFLGFQHDFYINLNKQFFFTSPINQKTILSGFNALAKSDYEPLVRDLKSLKNQYQLNDWAYIQLIQKLSLKYAQNSANSANLMSWFLLVKSGIKARISYAKNELYLLSPAKQALYDIDYFTYNKERFYVVSKHAKIISPLFSYKAEYPKKLDIADFHLKHEVVTKPQQQLTRLQFDFKQKRYNINIPYNKNNIDFLASYPQMDLEYYFQAANNNSTTSQFIKQLKPHVKQMNQTEAVNFLLRFVQTAFTYATDGDQFGEENYLFIEETVFYPKSDCEDRSILFAWLVDHILGLDVIGISFPGHVAAAVLLDKPKGSIVHHNGKQYTLADPTYINASVGMKMPQYKNIKATVIPKSL